MNIAPRLNKKLIIPTRNKPLEDNQYEWKLLKMKARAYSLLIGPWY